MNISGGSNAAKCPLLVSSLKYTTLANRFSDHRRDVRNISLGNIEQPTGTVTGSDSASAPRKLSQYRHAEDAAFAGSQYSITLSSNSSRVSTFSGWPLMPALPIALASAYAQTLPIVALDKQHRYG